VELQRCTGAAHEFAGLSSVESRKNPSFVKCLVQLVQYRLSPVRTETREIKIKGE
jgi:hypothetical protein